MDLRGTMLDVDDGNNNNDNDDTNTTMESLSAMLLNFTFFSLSIITEFPWRRKCFYSKKVVEVQKNRRHIIVLGPVNFYIVKPIFKPTKNDFEYLCIDLCQ